LKAEQQAFVVPSIFRVSVAKHMLEAIRASIFSKVMAAIEHLF
jgi:hypothetical protein